MMDHATIAGSCHCGAVRFFVADRPEQLVDCNCSICRRYRGLWAHVPLDRVHVEGDTIAYAYGDRTLAFCTCSVCGCTTHWRPLKRQDGTPWMAVNMAMVEPDEIADIPVRQFDGANSWSFLE